MSEGRRGVSISALLAVGAALPAVIAYAQKLFVSYGIYDEGLILYGAQRVRDGALPYADFWTLYPPGQYYVLAGLFRAFGTTIWVERVWSLVVVVAIVACVGGLVRAHASNAWAVVAAAASTIWLAHLPMFGSPLPVAMAFSLASLLLLEWGDHSDSKAALLGAGVLAGLTIGFRHDIGALLCLAQGLRLLPLGRRRSSQLLPWAVGAIATVLPAVLALLASVPHQSLLDSLIVFPATGFREVRALPWPTLDARGFVFYAIPVLLATSALRGAWLRGSDDAPTPGWWCALGFGCLLLQQASVRSDLQHMLPSGLLSIVVVCGLATRGATASAFGALSKWAIPALAALALLPALTTPVLQLLAEARPLSESRLPRAAGIAIPKAKQRYEEVIRFVRKQVPEGEKIFVGNARHDMLHSNDVIFYFLAERDSVSAYHELHPGIATTTAVQEQIARDLTAVNTVVLANVGAPESNQSGVSSGVTLLDDLIRREFAVVHRAAGYQILQRR